MLNYFYGNKVANEQTAHIVNGYRASPMDIRIMRFLQEKSQEGNRGIFCRNMAKKMMRKMWMTSNPAVMRAMVEV